MGLRFWRRRSAGKDIRTLLSEVKKQTSMSEPHPPARADPYLDELTKELLNLEDSSDAEYEKALNKLVAQASRDRTALESREKTKAVIREATSPGGIFRGMYISVMRDSALSFLRGHPGYEELCRVPVAMLPTGLLNGQACINPSNEPLILIDSGMMRGLTEIMHAFRGFFTWGWGEHAYCRDHSQLDFAQTIVMLTAVVLSGDPNLKALCPALLDKCPSIRPNSDRRAKLVREANRIRDFVLLHEYGHIALGHLTTSKACTIHIGPATVTGQVSSHKEEYDADAFALRAIASMRDRVAETESLDHVVAMLGEPIGVLLRFWDLMDAGVRRQGGQLTASHPSAISRWRRIRGQLTPSKVKKDFLSDVDDAFETILQWYQLESASKR